MKKNLPLLLSALTLAAFTFTGCNLRKEVLLEEVKKMEIKQSDNDDSLEDDVPFEDDSSEEKSSDTTPTYTITWKNYNGSVINTTKVDEGLFPVYGKAAPKRPNQGQYKYVFSGWQPEVCKATKNATYTATYTSELIEISVKWLNADGSELDSKNDYHVGDNVVFPENPTKTDSNFEYTFSHWVDEKNNEVSSLTLDGSKESYVLRPIFDKKEYTITWNNYDNTFLARSTVKSGELPVYPLNVNPSRPNDEHNNYTFTGWTTEIAKAHSDATYVAKYSNEVLPVKVKWLNHDGTTFKEEDYPVGNGSINLPATNPTKTDEYEWVFVKWETDNQKVPSECSLDGTTMQYTFKPVFEKQRYTITWKNYDNTVLDTKQVDSGVLPTTTATPKQKPNSGQYKYTLNGWDSEVVYAHSDKTYTAHFDESVINITVNFYKEDGTTLISTNNYTVGDTISVPAAPAKDKVNNVEYEFDHWEGLNGETLPTTALDDSKESYNFKAVYKAIAYEVKFVDYDGTSLAIISNAINNTYVGDAAYSSIIPSAETMAEKAKARKNDRYTYTFVGWARGDSSETDPVEDPTTHLIPKDDREGQTQTYVDLNWVSIKGDLTLHAVYDLTLRTYTVNFYGKDEDEKLGTLNPGYGSDVTFTGHDFATPSSFAVATEDGLGSTKYTWNNGFQYKDGDTYVYGLIKVKKDLDYFATYDNVYVPKQPFYFTSDSDFSIGLLKYVTGAPSVKIEYSKDGTNWTTYNTSTSTYTTYVKQTAGNKLYFRGTGNTAFAYNETGGNYDYFYVSGTNVKCKGNIEYLLDYATVDMGNHPTMANYCFRNLFYNCSKMSEAPELPATTLTTYCYSKMFYNCTSLKTAPDLPAQTLATYCYYDMFNSCTGLVNAPTVSALTTAERCCCCMFYNCKALTKAPELKPTNLTTYCYSAMFQGCTSLTEAVELPVATSLASNCYVSMFSGCSALKISENGSGTLLFAAPSSLVSTTHAKDMFTSTGGDFKGSPTAGNNYCFY